MKINTRNMIKMLFGILIIQGISCQVSITTISPISITNKEPTNIKFTFQTNDVSTIILPKITLTIETPQASATIVCPIATVTSLIIECLVTTTSKGLYVLKYDNILQASLTINSEDVAIKEIFPGTTYSQDSEQRILLTFNRLPLPKTIKYKTMTAKCDNTLESRFQLSCLMTFKTAENEISIYLNGDSTSQNSKIKVENTINVDDLIQPSIIDQNYEKQTITLEFIVTSTIDFTQLIPIIYSEKFEKLACLREPADGFFLKCTGLFNRIGTFPIYFGGIKTNRVIDVLKLTNSESENSSNLFNITLCFFLVIFIL